MKYAEFHEFLISIDCYFHEILLIQSFNLYLKHTTPHTPFRVSSQLNWQSICELLT